MRTFDYFRLLRVFLSILPSDYFSCFTDDEREEMHRGETGVACESLIPRGEVSRLVEVSSRGDGGVAVPVGESAILAHGGSFYS